MLILSPQFLLPRHSAEIDINTTVEVISLLYAKRVVVGKSLTPYRWVISSSSSLVIIDHEVEEVEEEGIWRPHPPLCSPRVIGSIRSLMRMKKEYM
jgi:hypothetical protein